MLSLLSGQEYRRVGGQSGKGPEWAGPCPVCGGDHGSDRFHIWPEQGVAGTFWCRKCGKGGDLVEYYRWAENLLYRDACARAGVDAQTYVPQSAPSARQFGLQNGSSINGWQPSATEPIAQLWAEHAAKFAEWCHLQLSSNPLQLEWLATRGIDMDMIVKYGLGWNPSDTWRPRASWGLEPVKRTDGKDKKLWLPCGLVIPQWIGETVARLRIRRPDVADGEMKYYVVPGSGREPLISRRGASAYVVVESELDEILLDGLCGDLVGVVAMGNASAKPTADLHALLSGAVHLSISLDSDALRVNPRTGKTECPGAQGSIWWLNQYRHADRVPVIGGKDPGDAYKAGIDLRSWVLAGLPPRFHLKRSVCAEPKPTQLPVQEPNKQPLPIDPDPAADKQINHHVLTMADGREIHVTDNREVWDQLTDEGRVVFSEQELLRIQSATAGMDKEDAAAAALLVVDIKEVFQGAYVRRGEVMA